MACCLAPAVIGLAALYVGRKIKGAGERTDISLGEFDNEADAARAAALVGRSVKRSGKKWGAGLAAHELAHAHKFLERNPGEKGNIGVTLDEKGNVVGGFFRAKYKDPYTKWAVNRAPETMHPGLGMSGVDKAQAEQAKKEIRQRGRVRRD